MPTISADSVLGRMRARLVARLSPFLRAQARWQQRRGGGADVESSDGEEELGDVGGLEGGEEEADEVDRARRDGAGGERRLSRDLEVGFRDDSEDEDEDGGGGDGRRMGRR